MENPSPGKAAEAIEAAASTGGSSGSALPPLGPRIPAPGRSGSKGGDSLQELLDGRVGATPMAGSSRGRHSSLDGAPRRGRTLGRENSGDPAARAARSGATLDFDEEAHKLHARLNLDPSSKNEGYNALDPLWRHPETGGTFFVGNQTAAANLGMLQQYKITHVVNCTDNMPLYHEASGKIKYFRFDITSFYRRVRTDEDAAPFVQPMLDFVGAALEDGKNVMAHCLAGAHRAGTTGCICLMHFAQLSNREAVPVAKRCRPIIDPIGDFPELLAKLERSWRGRR